MKTLKDFNFKNKTVLLRSDINSDVLRGRVIPNERIRESCETIKFLKKKGAKIVVIAHQGRKDKPDFTSLKQHAKLMSKITSIKFVDDIIGEKSKKEIENLKPSQAILLENIRNLEEEMNPGKNKFVDFFLDKVDIYINDAFSVCHRKQTSIVTFPKYLPSCAGLILQREVEALKKINMKNALFILGGAKPEDNIKLLGKNKTIATGFFGQLCLISKGIKFGEYENFLKELLKDEFKTKNKLKNKLSKVILPIDYAIKVDNKRKSIPLSEFPNDKIIYDIGDKTIELFKKEISKAKSIYIKGPSGDCRQKDFCKGTVEILKAASNSKAFTLIGGGHLNDAIDKSKIPRKKFGHISLSGGALLTYLTGKKLPGLVALERKALLNK